MKSLLDPTFRYTPSVSTDIGKTFARIRKAQRETAAQTEAVKAERAKDTQRIVDITNARRAGVKP